MNLMFWKKKKTVEPEHMENDATEDNNATDETLIAPTSEAASPKPGLWTRLKNALTPSRKKDSSDTVEAEEETEPSAKRKKDNPQDEEPEAPAPKLGFLARLIALLPSRKKPKVEDESEEKPEEHRPSAKRSGNRPQDDEEPEPSDIPTKKPGKKLVIVLALLIPIAAGGAFFIAKNMFSKSPQQAAPAKDAAIENPKTEEPTPAEPPETTGQAPQPEDAQPPAESAPQQEAGAEAPAAGIPEPAAEAPVAEAGADTPAEEDVPSQIQAMKKQNQEMQAQIEALKKHPAAEKSARPAVSPRDGVLIINGTNTKESAQGLKKIIESMNASSSAKDTEKK